MPPFRPLYLRLLEKVDVRGDEDCWLWTGACGGTGRPMMHVRLDDEGKRVIEHASRVMYRISYEEPADRHIHHTCGNSMCVNPYHLMALAPGDHMKLHTITHCKRAGHEYTPENTRIDKQGRRFCRACQADRARRLRTKKLETMRAYEREYARKKRAEKKAKLHPSAAAGTLPST